MNIASAKKLGKAAAAVACCGLCISAGLFGTLAIRKMPEINGKTAFANGFVYLQDDGDNIQFGHVDESFFAPGNLAPGGNTSGYYKYNEQAADWLMPGGSKEGTLTVSNKGSQIVSVYLYADSTGNMRNQLMEGTDDVPKEFEDFYKINRTTKAGDTVDHSIDYTPAQLKYLSDLLCSDENKLRLEIFIDDGDGNKENDVLVYSGSVNGHGSDTVTIDGSNNKMDNSHYTSTYIDPEDGEEYTDEGDNYIDLGMLYPDLHNTELFPDVYDSIRDMYDGSDTPQTVTYRFKLTAGKGLKSFLEGTEKSVFYRDYANRAAKDHGFAGSIAMIDWVFVTPPQSWTPVEPPPEPPSEPRRLFPDGSPRPVRPPSPIRRRHWPAA